MVLCWDLRMMIPAITFASYACRFILISLSKDFLGWHGYHYFIRLKARLGMGPDSPGQLCPEEWQHGILLISRATANFELFSVSNQVNMCEWNLVIFSQMACKLFTPTSYRYIYYILYFSNLLVNKLDITN